MSKLTTELLEKFVSDIKTDGMCDITDHQVALALRQLLAYEQAAKNKVALPEALKYAEIYGRAFICVDRNGSVHAVDPSQITITILNEPANAQPVIPEQANILGYFSFDPEDCAEILKDRQTAIDNCNASIDLYRESMQEEYPDGWSDDVKRVCWGVILQEARGFDAQGIPENDPNHTYQTLDYRLAPDLTTAVTTQLVSEPYKLPSGWKLVPIEPTAAMFHAFNDCDYGRKSMRERYIQMIEAAPAQESE